MTGIVVIISTPFAEIKKWAHMYTTHYQYNTLENDCSIVRSLYNKLPHIPMMLVAMVTEGSHDNQLLEEGRDLAEKWGAMFIASSDGTWGSE